MNETTSEPQMFRLLRARIRSVRDAIAEQLAGISDDAKSPEEAREVIEAFREWEAQVRKSMNSLLDLIRNPPAELQTSEPAVFAKSFEHMLPATEPKREPPQFDGNMATWPKVREWYRWAYFARRAWMLRLCAWCDDEMTAFHDAAFPRIKIIECALRSHVACVELARSTYEKPIQDKQRDLLVELAEMKPVNIKRLNVRTKLEEKIPELSGLILTVDGSKGNAWVRLDPRMKGRIT